MRMLSATFSLLGALLAGALAPGNAPAAAPAGTAVLVNGEPISLESFRNELKRVERLALREGKTPPSGAGRRQVLEKLIARELLYQEARRQGVGLPPGETVEKLAELSESFPEEKGLEEALDRMGLSREDLAGQLERGLVVKKYLELNFSQGAPVSEADIEGYYREHPDEFGGAPRVRLSHILLKTDPAREEEEKKELSRKMERLRIRLFEGEDFARLAREASQCYSARNGGDLGYFAPGALSPAIEQALGSLKPGEVSGVVEDRYGLHLLKLTERGASVLPLEKVRERIRERLTEQKLKPNALTPFLRKLRNEAKVEFLLDGDQLP